MKKGLIMVVILVILAASVFAATKISLRKVRDCKTVDYDETEDIYDYVTKERDVWGTCDGYSAENDTAYEYPCITGTEEYQSYEKVDERVLHKNREVCKDKSLQITVEKLTNEEYNLEYGDWGKCGYENEGDALVITCDSRFDGNNDGVCKPGESCIQFRITEDGVQRLERNSRYDWVENDDTFVQTRLKMEVAK